MIREVTINDTKDICKIYNFYVNQTVITFEEEEVTLQEMEKRINEVKTNFPWLVYEDGGEVIGYAYASQWKNRSAYRFSVESTVYLSNAEIRKGIGSKSAILLFRIGTA